MTSADLQTHRPVQCPRTSHRLCPLPTSTQDSSSPLSSCPCPCGSYLDLWRQHSASHPINKCRHCPQFLSPSSLTLPCAPAPPILIYHHTLWVLGTPPRRPAKVPASWLTPGGWYLSSLAWLMATAPPFSLARPPAWPPPYLFPPRSHHPQADRAPFSHAFCLQALLAPGSPPMLFPLPGAPWQGLPSTTQQPFSHSPRL